MLLEHRSPPVMHRNNIVVVDEIVGLILYRSPPVARRVARVDLACNFSTKLLLASNVVRMLAVSLVQGQNARKLYM